MCPSWSSCADLEKPAAPVLHRPEVDALDAVVGDECAILSRQLHAVRLDLADLRSMHECFVVRCATMGDDQRDAIDVVQLPLVAIQLLSDRIHRADPNALDSCAILLTLAWGRAEVVALSAVDQAQNFHHGFFFGGSGFCAGISSTSTWWNDDSAGSCAVAARGYGLWSGIV